MNIKLSFFLIIFTFHNAFSQNTEGRKPKMDFYFNPSLNIGFNIKSKQDQNTNNSQYMEPRSNLGKFTYGVTAIGGYNFIPNFALGTGLKYSFAQDNYHLIYWVIQPKIIFSPGDRPFYIDINYGKQLNRSVVSGTEFWGGRLGMQVSYSKRLSQEGGIVFEAHRLKNQDNGFFIGLSYGVTIFSNKNYTGYGQD